MMYHGIMYARIKLRVSEKNDCLGIEIPNAIIGNTRYLYEDENDIIRCESVD